MIRSSLLASVAISPFLLSTAFAQEVFDLGEIVVSGSLTPVTEGQTGATVEILDSTELSGKDTSVIARLDRLPGVNSSSNGGVGSSTTIRIRGLSPQYVGVRFDGIDITDPSSLQTQFNFGGLLPSGIDRIEVLKGSQSALYGSEAIAGVVDVTSFRPEEFGFSGKSSLEFGSFGTASASVSTGYKTDRGFVALTYGRFVSDGFSGRSQDSATTTQTEDDGFNQTTLNATGEYAVTDRLSIGMALFVRDGTLDYDIGRTEPAGYIESEEVGARIYAKLNTGVVNHTFSYSYFDSDRNVQLQQFFAPRDFYVENYQGTRRNLAYLGSAQLSDRVTLNFGMDYTEEEYRSSGIFAREENTSINGEILYSPSNRFDFSAALRYDDNSTFGGETTGRLAGVWRPSDSLALRAVIGTGFRAPSLNERFGPFGANADLTPEESVSYELGVEKTFARGSLKATLFQTEIDDRIGYESSYVQVSGTTRSRGLEFAAQYDVGASTNVFGNYTYTDAKTDGTRLTRTPRHDLVLGVDTQFSSRLSAGVDLRYVADVVPSAFAPADNKVGDYSVMGANVSFDLSDTAQAYLRVENLFDEDYETAGGFNTPGRSAFFGIRADF